MAHRLDTRSVVLRDLGKGTAEVLEREPDANASTKSATIFRGGGRLQTKALSRLPTPVGVKDETFFNRDWMKNEVDEAASTLVTITRATVLSIATIVAYTLVSNYFFPLPNQPLLLPFFVLSGYAAATFGQNAAIVLHYLRDDFGRAIIASMVFVGLLTWSLAAFFPAIAVQFVVYTTIFYVTSALIRSTYEATSFIFREDVDRGETLYRAFATCRLTYYAATAIIFVAQPEASLVTAVQVGIYLVLVFLVQEYTDRPMIRYLLGGERVSSEIRVLKALRRKPLADDDLQRSAHLSADPLKVTLVDMRRRGLVKSDGNKWELGRAYRRILVFSEAKRRKRTKKSKVPTR